MYSVRDGQVYFDEKAIGSSRNMFSDFRQDYAGQYGTERVTLKVGDVLAVTSHGAVLLIEEKKVGDLVSSYTARRLQRQLRHMLQTNPDGINALAIRGDGNANDLQAIMQLLSYQSVDLTLDLVKWQIFGGLVVFVPAAAGAAVDAYLSLSSSLTPGRHLYTVVAGNDQETRRNKSKGLTATAEALRRLIPGVGPVLAEAWAAAAEQDLVTALTMSNEKLKDLGANKTVVARRGELCKS